MKEHSLFRSFSRYISLLAALCFACMILLPVNSFAEEAFASWEDEQYSSPRGMWDDWETDEPEDLSDTSGTYLTIGSYSDEVYEVQSILAQLGYYSNVADGYYGYSTYYAVAAFQEDYGLYVDGEAGPVTLSMLYASAGGFSAGTAQTAASASSSETDPGETGSDVWICVGANNDTVTWLQNILHRLGYLNDSPDGYFGSVTEAAVKQFQQQYGLYADGIVGPATMAVLRANNGSQETAAGSSASSSAEAVTIDYSVYLSVGSTGDMVSQVQKALETLGYYNGGVDGIYGSYTAAAVSAYQSACGLYADGEVGPMTLASLLGSSSGSQASSGSVSQTGAAGSLRYGGTYVLASTAGGAVLDVSGGSANDGAWVDMDTADGEGSQKWVLQSAGNGYYYIRNLHSWKVLDLSGNYVIQNDAAGTSSQMWQLMETDGGYQIVNANGMYLDASSGSVTVSTQSGSGSQLWTAYEVDPGTAIDFTKDGTQYVGIRTFEISQGNVTETSGYYHLGTDIDLPSGAYDVSGGDNYSIGLKVVYINSFLAAAGYLDSSYYGYARYDSNTVYAVTSFQRDYGLIVDGVVGLQTWTAMGYSEDEYNNLGTYTTDLKVSAYGSSSDTYVDAMLATAKEYADAGTGFADGASGAPGTYVDCSGLIFQCLYAAGINPSVNIVDHARVVYEYTSDNLGNDSRMGVAVSTAEPGDLIFYGGSSITHSAIYAGNGMVYDAYPGIGVSLRSIYSGGNILKIVRVF